MARKSNPIFRRNNGLYYARWWDEQGKDGKRGHRVALSLDTTDYAVAMERYPYVKNSKMGYNEFLSSGLIGLGPQANPLPDEIKNSADYQCILNTWRNDVRAGRAHREQGVGYPYEEGLRWRYTETSDNPGSDSREILPDNFDKISEFYQTAVPTLFLDKVQTKRNVEIWLKFLAEKSIQDWTQIDEALMNTFYQWRRDTPIKPEAWGKREGVKPTTRTVNRHMQFLRKSFRLAISKKFMISNPLEFWKPQVHHAPQQQALTKSELINVLSDPVFDKDFLMNGLKKAYLGYTIRDLVLILFVSCKRRGEVVNLKIDNVNYSSHYVYYRETKNSSRGTPYVINKAFFLAPGMGWLLKKVIGKRTTGLIFPSPWDEDKGINPEKISVIFSEVVKRIVPNKDISINNLRHTATTLMEDVGLTDDEIDAALGHHQIKTALPNYQDRSADAIARRLSKRTEKGIKVLCRAVKAFLK